MFIKNIKKFITLSNAKTSHLNVKPSIEERFFYNFFYESFRKLPERRLSCDNCQSIAKTPPKMFLCIFPGTYNISFEEHLETYLEKLDTGRNKLIRKFLLLSFVFDGDSIGKLSINLNWKMNPNINKNHRMQLNRRIHQKPNTGDKAFSNLKAT